MNKVISNVLETRQTVKAYSDKKISNEDWQQILDTIYWSPSSHGFEPYRVLIVNKDNSLRDELVPLMWKQGVVKEADKMVFYISLDHKTFSDPKWLFEMAKRKFVEISGQTGKEADESAKKMADVILNGHFPDEPHDDWAMKQAYIALGMSMYTASILGIGSTPMEGLTKKPLEKLFKEKGLMQPNERLAVATAFGYTKDKTSYAHWGTGKRIRRPRNQKFTEI